MISALLTEATSFVANSVVPIVNAFRMLQDTNGCVIGNLDEAKLLLKRLLPLVRTTYSMIDAPSSCADAFETDTDLWISQGLSTPPHFDNSLDAYVPPSPDMTTFFIAPLVATNGPVPCGAFMECFLGYRKEPAELEQVRALFPYANSKNACISCRLLTGSTGLLTGDCIVFFPENVATAKKVESQTFALVFLNKFQHIFLSKTLPGAQFLFGKQHWTSAQLAPEDCYSARSIWCYMHDYFHQCGPRPLDSNLQIKMNFFVGLLEEIKVDSQAVVEAHSNKNIPFGDEVVEFILLERLLRYPHQNDPTTNFDAGAGILLFEWLLQDKQGLYESENGLNIDIGACVTSMLALAEKIETIEATRDDVEYRHKARNFVRTLLPVSTNGARFSIPDSYSRLVQLGNIGSLVLNFDGLLC